MIRASIIIPTLKHLAVLSLLSSITLDINDKTLITKALTHLARREIMSARFAEAKLVCPVKGQYVPVSKVDLNSST